jgi:hypothetical protein
MSVVLAAVHGLSAIMMGAAATFAFLFYRDFFASESFPLEWNLLLAGMGGIALSFLFRAGDAVLDVGLLGPGTAIFLLLGSALLVVAGFILWDKFRL